MVKRKAVERQNPISSALHGIISVIVWISGLLVSLAVGFGMIYGTLTVPNIPQFVLAIGGWTVIILTVCGALLALMHSFTKNR